MLLWRAEDSDGRETQTVIVAVKIGELRMIDGLVGLSLSLFLFFFLSVLTRQTVSLPDV